MINIKNYRILKVILLFQEFLEYLKKKIMTLTVPETNIKLKYCHEM